MKEPWVWALSAHDNDWLQSLVKQGYRLQCFQQTAHFRSQYRAEGVKQAAAVLLMADLVSNCQVAQGVRAHGSVIPVLALATQTAGAESAALLSVGVDHIVRPGDRPDSLRSLLRALDYRRARAETETQPPLTHPLGMGAVLHRIGAWWLDERGWRLVCDGASTSLRLTSGERALLLCIFETPGHVLDHEALMAAVLRDWTTRRQTDLKRTGCRAIIDRLRARARRAGLPRLPLESVRDFGYIWAF